MALQIVSVTVTATRQNLGSLISAALGQTLQSYGTTSQLPGPRVGQLTLQAAPGNGGAIYVGLAAMTPTNSYSIAAGTQAVFGSGFDLSGDTNLLYVQTATGTGLLNVVWTD